MASEPRTPEAISKDLIAALHELAVLRSKLADLYEGHAAVLPKNEDHARKMMAVASAFLPNIDAEGSRPTHSQPDNTQ